MKEFEKQGQLGFGFMRIPQTEGRVDVEKTIPIVDRYMALGGRYFDTARGYIDGESEIGLRESVVKRYPRERYAIADKLSDPYFESEADLLPFFESQLEAVGVDYFDYYLIHSVTAKNYKKYTACNAFEFLKSLKAQGRVRHIGFSFHDSAALLEEILAAHPEMEFVQIQFNYEDFEDPGIQSRLVYQVCAAHNKPVIVMEPLKGGNLAKLPEEAAAVLDGLRGGSPASYALRFAASFPQVKMILSGMSSIEEVEDNSSVLSGDHALADAEKAAISKVQALLRAQQTVKCTACRYCVKGCPMNIPIPEVFSAYNAQMRYGGWNSRMYYSNSVRGKGRASACIECGACEDICPQHLPIREHLKAAAEMFDRKK